MIKLYTFTLRQNANFGQLELKAGTELGIFQTELEIDPVAVLNLMQYNSLGMVDVAFTEIDPEELLMLPNKSEDPSLAGESESDDDSEGGDSQSPSVDSVAPATVEPAVAKSDLYSIGLTEATVRALEAAGLGSVQLLLEYVKAGKPLGDIDRVGPAKVEAIMAAIEKLIDAPSDKKALGDSKTDSKTE